MLWNIWKANGENVGVLNLYIKPTSDGHVYDVSFYYVLINSALRFNDIAF
jgi:hypothetical protein